MERLLQQLGGDIVLVLVFVGFGLLVYIKQWPEWMRRIRAANWPITQGVIENGDVSTIRSQSRYFDHLENATATLGYSYRVNGEYYSGYHTETFNDEQKAWTYVDALRGQAVQVSYDPRKPDISILGRQPMLSNRMARP